MLVVSRVGRLVVRLSSSSAASDVYRRRAWDRACAQRWQGCGDTGDALGANEQDRGEPKELCQTSPWQKGWSPGARARSFAVAGCQKAAQEGVVIDHRLGVGYMAINQEVNKHVGRDLDE